MFENNKLFNILVVVLSVFLIALTVSTIINIGEKSENDRENTIAVSATGEIYAKPDLALIDFSVITEAKTVAQAMSENTAKMNKVIKFIKEQGVEDKDLKTVSFNIYPRYEYKSGAEYYPPGERALVGYEVRQQLEVKIRDLEKVGQIIEGVADSGVNQIGDLRFTIDNQDELKEKAREEAIKKAKEKAEKLAFQLGIKLKKITSFSESGQVPIFYEKALDLGVGGAGPEIETGENKISVTVNITYEID